MSTRTSKATRERKPITMDPTTYGCIVSFSRPGRIDIGIFDGVLQVFVYEGADVDMEQDPLFVYDGMLDKNNKVIG